MVSHDTPLWRGPSKISWTGHRNCTWYFIHLSTYLYKAAHARKCSDERKNTMTSNNATKKEPCSVVCCGWISCNLGMHITAVFRTYGSSSLQHRRSGSARCSATAFSFLVTHIFTFSCLTVWWKLIHVRFGFFFCISILITIFFEKRPAHKIDSICACFANGFLELEKRTYIRSSSFYLEIHYIAIL